MRRIISCILIIFICIWSYNLFINNFIDLEKPEDESYKGVIKILDSPIDGNNRYNNRRWMQNMISSFEKNNPGIYIEWTSKDDLPDIVPVDLKFEDFNVLESLDEYFEKDQLDEFKHQVLKPLTYEKELKAVPIAMSSYALYLNLERFNEKGVSPPLNGDWTYEEFVDSLEKLTYESEEEERKEYGFMAPIDIGYYNIWGIILSDGAELINPKRLEYNFYGEKAIKGLEKVIDLKNKYKVVADGFGSMDEEDAWKMFSEDQNVAVYITGSWAVKTLDELYKNGDGFNFDIANYPIGNKGLPVVLSDGIVSYGVVENDNPIKTKACVDFLKYLTNDSNQRSLKDIGLFTVKRQIKDMYTDNIKMRKIEESLSYTEYIPFIDNWAEIESIIDEELKRAILGRKFSYEGIEDAKIKIDKINEK